MGLPSSKLKYILMHNTNYIHTPVWHLWRVPTLSGLFFFMCYQYKNKLSLSKMDQFENLWCILKNVNLSSLNR